ncbi:hypothetical protein J7I93_01205 [Bacillus sp. ISL-47]|uniref:hypothetical protein n=1 Tax=Bacillus sp. ISL-47 TaxID=2819130 RepID=UPI001BE93F39|nr:hypothetical protein [Bacillus sp. ISL-47]MBT2686792.1 hypothetical protein [Bacillus sp. ISL-47]MBT2706855.1 hypothetical protein [Pseudomonas sp. ISL-84]
MTQLSSKTLEFNLAQEAVDHFFEKGWTDGLPIIPPTPERVQAMLDYVKAQPSDIVGTIPERNRFITAEKMAINAVMAGCIPAYMPVVMAAMEAVLDPQFGVHGPTASTGGASILLIVNGPIIHQIGLNTGKNLMGGAHRANATIGRAIGLIMKNAGGSSQFDQTTIGHPGKISFCMGEADVPEWDPLHVERGFNRSDSTVTAFASEGPHQINNHVAHTPEGILMSIADMMTNLATFHMQRSTQCALVLCPEHVATLLENGWDKAKVKDFLFEHARRKKSEFYPFGLRLEPVADGEDEWVPAFPSPDDLLLVTGGGPAGRFSSFIPGWGSVSQSIAVTKPVRLSGFT